LLVGQLTTLAATLSLAAALTTLTSACTGGSARATLWLEGFDLGDLLFREFKVLPYVAAHQKGHRGHAAAATLAEAATALSATLASALGKCE
jgi:hypothetical protein